MIKNSNKGFTLVELLITLVIVAIVMTVAIPGFNTLILNNRSIALGEDLASALNFVRSEAVKRGTTVSICPSNDGENCVNNGAWTDGFIAFVDTASSDTAPEPTVGTVLRVWDGTADGASISVERGGISIDFIRFTGMGTLARITDEAVQLDAEVAHCTGNSGRTLTVGLSGMVGVSKKTCT